MEVGASIWAHNSADSVWFKARVIKLETIVPKSRSSNKKLVQSLVKFTLVKVDDNENQISNSEDISTFYIEGESDEYELVKLRNSVDYKPQEIDDISILNNLNEPCILDCLKARYSKCIIYTNSGPILIAVNPFRSLPIYSREVSNIYISYGSTETILDDKPSPPPHVFRIADMAYRNMIQVSRIRGLSCNQSILVSGESGAGKTASTKYIMRYLAEINIREGNENGNSIEKQILQSNPLLESFGNARTLRNDNSSRFGKFIELKFSSSVNSIHRMIGATIKTYLLEKVRLVRHGPGERNFHCFYEIVKGGSDADRTRWGLTSLDDYHYTNQSGEQNRQDGVDDREQYKETRAAMDDMNFSSEEQNSVLDVVAALLHLGNVTFDVKVGLGEEEDGSTFSSSCELHVECCCDLLGLSREGMEKVLCEKQIKTRERVLSKRQTAREAEYGREALAKTIYGALFDWVGSRVNQTIGSEAGGLSSKSCFIGVLDIFGFESFRTNSFEQLCINYTNERLQQHFNEFVFNDEQKLYTREGISWNFIQFPDNSEILDLLENRRQGIFALCDEQVLFPKATDSTLVNKLYEYCRAHPRFHAGNAEVARGFFVVKHFAGPVTYGSESFLEKNRDMVRSDMAQLLHNSSKWLPRSLYSFFRLEEPGADGGASAGAGMGMTVSGKSSKKIFTLSAEFRKQLGELMEIIHSTSPHYVRCLKPNSKNVSGVFEDSMVVDQLRCNGVLEAVRVSRVGFPNRFTFEQFVRMYGALVKSPSADGWTRSDVLKLCEELAKEALASPSFVPAKDATTLSDVMSRTGIQKGSSLIFLRRGTYEYLERNRLLLQSRCAVSLQKHVRRYLAQHQYRSVKESTILIQCSIRCWRARRRTSVIRFTRSCIIIQRVFRGFRTRLTVSKTMPHFSRAHEKVEQMKAERRRLMMMRIANASIVAHTWRRVTSWRKSERLKAAAVKIQAIVRMFLHRELLTQTRERNLKLVVDERNALIISVAELKWQLQIEMKTRRDVTIELESKIVLMQTELMGTKQQLRVAEGSSEGWCRRASTAMSELNDCIGLLLQYEAQTQDYNLTIQSQLESIGLLQTKNEKLVKELRTLEVLHEGISDELRCTIEQANKDKDDSLKSLETLNKKIMSQDDIIKTLELENLKLKTELAQSQENCERMRLLEESLKANVSIYLSENLSQQETIAVLKAAISEGQRKYEGLAQAKEELVEDVGRLRQEVETGSRSTSELQSTAEDMRSRLRSVEQALDEEKQSRASLEDVCRMYEGQFTESEGRILRLRQDLEGTSNMNSNLEKKINELIDELAIKRKAVDELRQVVEMKELEESRLNIAFSELEKEKVASGEEIERLKHEMSILIAQKQVKVGNRIDIGVGIGTEDEDDQSHLAALEEVEVNTQSKTIPEAPRFPLEVEEREQVGVLSTERIVDASKAEVSRGRIEQSELVVVESKQNDFSEEETLPSFESTDGSYIVHHTESKPESTPESKLDLDSFIQSYYDADRMDLLKVLVKFKSEIDDLQSQLDAIQEENELLRDEVVFAVMSDSAEVLQEDPHLMAKMCISF